MDTRVQQKLTESILWEAIGCMEFTIFFSVCKLLSVPDSVGGVSSHVISPKISGLGERYRNFQFLLRFFPVLVLI